MDNKIKELEEKLLRKEQECERLEIDRERWKSNFNGKVTAIEELLQQLDQLKQTLTEIKDIAEEKANVNDWLALQILQKISECEGNDGN